MAKLTEKQEKFAQAVGLEGLSQSDAYRRAYGAENWTEQALHVQAYRTSKIPHVADRIAKLKADRAATAAGTVTFDVRKLFETYMAIAFVDPNELIAQKVGACRHCYGENGLFQWKETEYTKALASWELACAATKSGPLPEMPDIAGGLGYRFTRPPNPECIECEGEGITRIVPMDTTRLSPGAKLLYKGVQQTKDGVKVLFRDQDKALEQIGRILGAFDDKMRIDLTGKVASMRLETDDPQKAAEAYTRMVSGGG